MSSSLSHSSSLSCHFAAVDFFFWRLDLSRQQCQPLGMEFTPLTHCCASGIDFHKTKPVGAWKRQARSTRIPSSFNVAVKQLTEGYYSWQGKKKNFSLCFKRGGLLLVSCSCCCRSQHKWQGNNSSKWSRGQMASEEGLGFSRKKQLRLLNTGRGNIECSFQSSCSSSDQSCNRYASTTAIKFRRISSWTSFTEHVSLEFDVTHVGSTWKKDISRVEKDTAKLNMKDPFWRHRTCQWNWRKLSVHKEKFCQKWIAQSIAEHPSISSFKETQRSWGIQLCQLCRNFNRFWGWHSRGASSFGQTSTAMQSEQLSGHVIWLLYGQHSAEI